MVGVRVRVPGWMGPVGVTFIKPIGPAGMWWAGGRGGGGMFGTASTSIVFALR